MKAILLTGVLLAAAPLRAEGPKPLTADEAAALRFLDFVTAPMSEADEKGWWGVGGRRLRAGTSVLTGVGVMTLVLVAVLRMNKGGMNSGIERA